MDHGDGRSINVTMITPSSSVTVDGEIRLSGFIISGFIASENVDLPYFGGPWKDYQCHSETTSNQLHYLVFLLFNFHVQCEVLFHVELIMATVKHLDKARL